MAGEGPDPEAGLPGDLPPEGHGDDPPWEDEPGDTERRVKGPDPEGGLPDDPHADDDDQPEDAGPCAEGPIMFATKGGDEVDGAELLPDLEARWPGRNWPAWLRHEAERRAANAEPLPSAGALNVLLALAADYMATLPEDRTLPLRQSGRGQGTGRGSIVDPGASSRRAATSGGG